MSKSPAAFRTISEVAEELALPQHVLRFWETRFTSIKPMKRGGGRRYYRPDDVDLLRGIRALLYGEGYTIRGVQRILKEQGPRSVIAAARGGGVTIAPTVPPRPSPVVEAIRAVSQARPVPVAPAPVVRDEPEDDAADIRVEPAFTPKEFRPATLSEPRPAAPSSPNGALPTQEVRRLEAALTHLLELKRLLDSSRD